MSANGNVARRRVHVDGRQVNFAEGGSGLPVVFLHGWGLGHRTYENVLQELAASCHVLAPSLPGFGGTADLPYGRRNIEGYATWVRSFLDALEVSEPVVLVGHSFGGGVAIRVAHDSPSRVRSLVLVNSVGGATWYSTPGGAVRQAERPLWQYQLEMVREMFCAKGGLRIARAIRDDLFANLLRNPWAMAEIGMLAATTDLTLELTELRKRELPVMVVWSKGDGVIPAASFDTLCGALGASSQVLDGGHSWLLANPRAFSQVLQNVMHVEADEGVPDAGATTSELRRLLRMTTMPAARVRRLLADASPLWMASEPASILAGDLALCHPALGDGEVRAVARPLDQPNAYRLTVVAADRPGLFADTAAALAAENLSVMSASAATWTSEGIALHALTFRVPKTRKVDWELLGAGLRSMGSQPRAASRFMPLGRARVTVRGEGSGRTLVEVRAPDTLGLLEATASWFADHGVNIEAARVATRHGSAVDTFLVDGDFEAAELETALSWEPPRRSSLGFLSRRSVPA